MIEPAGRFYHRALAEPTASVTGRRQPPSPQSFADEMAGTIANTVQTLPLRASLPVRQQIVSGRNPGDASVPAPGSASGSVDTSTVPSSASGVGSSAQPVSFDDAYWAKQPAAVQQLRNIQDPAQRADAASQLAQEGYTIDVPIMVWGWDPATTMAARQAMNYTWVPSALQQPVSVAPGVTFAGTSYDGAHPPAGSIAV